MMIYVTAEASIPFVGLVLTSTLPYLIGMHLTGAPLLVLCVDSLKSFFLQSFNPFLLESQWLSKE